MNHYVILISAILPIIILLFYIFRKDKKQPEPISLLIKAFLYGIISLFLSLCMSIPLGVIGAYPEEITTFTGAISTAFFGAAIPEEIAKFFMLWLLLRKNPYFDEKMDGIVYAVFVSLGFAALENIFYLFDNIDDLVAVGIIRALFAVPGHFCFGVLMGYYYSLMKFYPQVTVRTKTMALGAPIIAHGLYDAILMSMGTIPILLALVLMVVFIVFCYKMWKFASLRIKENLLRDYIDCGNKSYSE